jgi:hypothetical protein
MFQEVRLGRNSNAFPRPPFLRGDVLDGLDIEVLAVRATMFLMRSTTKERAKQLD